MTNLSAMIIKANPTTFQQLIKKQWLLIEEFEAFESQLTGNSFIEPLQPASQENYDWHDEIHQLLALSRHPLTRTEIINNLHNKLGVCKREVRYAVAAILSSKGPLKIHKLKLDNYHYKYSL